MTNEATTLMGREEHIGKRYPLWIERLMLLMAVVVFILTRETIADAVDQPCLLYTSDAADD